MAIISIQGSDFCLDGKPLHQGRVWNGISLKGLLLNSRMVQGAFDDANPETRAQWAYPDGTPFDPERNTAEFLENMPLWKAHGLDAFTYNLQGGSPRGYSKEQPWLSSGLNADGTLKPDYLRRWEAIISRADELGLVVILGIFYFGQEPRLDGESAIRSATERVVDWIIQRRWRHVLLEINNECDVPRYRFDISRPARVHELITLAQERSTGRVDTPAGRLLVSTSYGGGTIPRPNVVGCADYLLIHGNGVKEPRRITEMVAQTRDVEGYRGQPILFNEDDHFDFGQPDNNFVAALRAGAGWGYFDWRMPGEGFEQGYQSLPVDWGINSDRKRGFFNLVKAMTGA